MRLPQRFPSSTTPSWAALTAGTHAGAWSYGDDARNSVGHAALPSRYDEGGNPKRRVWPRWAKGLLYSHGKIDSLTRWQGSPWFDQGDSQGLAYRFSVVKAGRPRKDAVAEVVSSLQGQPAIAVARQCGGASAMATAQPSGREGMRSPRWEVQQSPCAVISATRSSALSKAGMKTVPAKSHCARASGSPWGCSLPSSLPLCGSVMTLGKSTSASAHITGVFGHPLL